MRIIQLTAENIKRIKAVDITTDPEGSMVVVAGRNEQGKSSALDAIAYALGGEKMLPAAPVRKGAKKGKVTVDLGAYIVTRTMTEGGGGALTVTNRDGLRYPTPQALLDGLMGRLSFDPLAFAGMKPAEQASTLRALAGIDAADIETRRKAAYDARTNVNRDLSLATAAAQLAPKHDPTLQEVSTAALTAELDKADQLQRAATDADRQVSIARAKVDSATEREQRAAKKVDALRAALEEAERESDQQAMAVSMALDGLADATRTFSAAAGAVPDRAVLLARMSESAAINRQVAENQKAQELADRAVALKAEADRLTAVVAGCETEKSSLLASAKFPVDGLGLDDNGVTWLGLPFTQASTAVRTRVSVAIGLALNPTLKVLLVRGGNDLDDQSLALVADQAAAADAQVWLERIAGGKGVPGTQTIVFEDGEVV